MKEIIAWAGQRLGYSIVPNWRLSRSNVAMASRLRDIFAHFSIERVIDVGAHIGEYGEFLREDVGFKGAIDSFEPVPQFAERLKTRAAADPRWSVHACALGREAGELAINVTVGPRYSSFHTPRRTNIADHDRRNTVVNTVVVPISTLDVEMGHVHNLNRTYLKLDTQGFDLEVVAGGQKTLPDIPALQSEISFTALYEGMPSYRESLTTFEQHGFFVADMFLVTSDGKHRAMEFDCVMVRPS